tara:strand:+ start:11322 stop:12374 length:1053 start_codon:yes stop_codon:yes gene_type:complete
MPVLGLETRAWGLGLDVYEQKNKSSDIKVKSLSDVLGETFGDLFEEIKTYFSPSEAATTEPGPQEYYIPEKTNMNDIDTELKKYFSTTSPIRMEYYIEDTSSSPTVEVGDTSSSPTVEVGETYSPQKMEGINEPKGGGDVVFTKSFVELMGESEGTVDHQGSEGQFTYAYGILPATATSLGLDPANYSNRKQFAEAVYGAMYKNAKTTYADVYKGMTDSEKKATLSLNINLGRLPDGIVTALSGNTKDFNAAGDTLKEVVHYTAKQDNAAGTMIKGVMYASKGLSKRRAEEFNTLMAGQTGFSEVTRIEVEGTKAAPIFVWKDDGGNEVKRFASSKTLSPDNSMTAIDIQ